MKRYRIDYTNQISNHTVIEADSEGAAREIFKNGEWKPEVGDNIDSQEITDITEEVNIIDPSAGLPVVPLSKNSKTPLLN